MRVPFRRGGGDPLDPQFADLLRRRLLGAGEERLAATVDELSVFERCRCGEPGCASFYTLPRRELVPLWRLGGRTLPLGPGLAVDVVGERIVAVELIAHASA